MNRRKTTQQLLSASLFLLLGGNGLAVLADGGQLSSWSDSNYVDFPLPPVGGWEGQLPELNLPLEETVKPENVNAKTQTGASQPVTAAAPVSTAPPANTNYTMPSTGAAFSAPAAEGYLPGRPAMINPGYNRGYVRPGFNRPAYPVQGFGAPTFNRGYNMPAFNGPRVAIPPSNYGNPWNAGRPGGWAATPWGERGPAGWTYPVGAGSYTNVNSNAGALNTQGSQLNIPAGYNTPTVSTPDAADVVENKPAEVQGFNWSVR